MAHKKGVGSTDNGRDSKSKRLGVKLFGGQQAKAGNIIIRQRGTKYHAGENTYLGRDYTLHAAVDGKVSFDKRRNNRVFVNIIPNEDQSAMNAPRVIKNRNYSKPKAAPVAEEETSTLEQVAVGVVESAKGVVENVKEVVENVVENVKEVVEDVVENVEDKVEDLEDVVEDKAEDVVEDVKEIVKDNLTKIEGIGPKIASLLNDANIHSFKDLSEATVEALQEVLDNAGSRYRVHNPGTWAKQAAMAFAGNWEELKAYQDKLDGGKEPTTE